MTPKRRRRFVQSLQQLERRLESDACYTDSSRKRDIVKETMQVHDLPKERLQSHHFSASHSANSCRDNTTVEAKRHFKEMAEEMHNVASSAKKGISMGTLSCLNHCADVCVSSANIDGSCDHNNTNPRETGAIGSMRLLIDKKDCLDVGIPDIGQHLRADRNNESVTGVSLSTAINQRDNCHAFVEDSGLLNEMVGVRKSMIENDDTSPDFPVKHQDLPVDREDILMVKNSLGKREFLDKVIMSQVNLQGQCDVNIQNCENATYEGIAHSAVGEEKGSELEFSNSSSVQGKQTLSVSQTGIVPHDARLLTYSGDSSCPIVFSPNWDPWDVGRANRGSESIPPLEFLATPLATPLSARKSIELVPTVEFRSDNLNCATEDNENITLLSVLLGVTIDGFSQLHMSNELQLSVLQDGDGCAVKHEQPDSLFYVNVAKVKEQNSNHAKCIDDCLEQLAKSQEEPYSVALLLIAKASLQNDHNSCKIEPTLEFPQIVAEWLQRQQSSY